MMGNVVCTTPNWSSEKDAWTRQDSPKGNKNEDRRHFSYPFQISNDPPSPSYLLKPRCEPDCQQTELDWRLLEAERPFQPYYICIDKNVTKSVLKYGTLRTPRPHDSSISHEIRFYKNKWGCAKLLAPPQTAQLRCEQGREFCLHSLILAKSTAKELREFKGQPEQHICPYLIKQIHY